MNYWSEYKYYSFKEDLNNINIAEAIAYANLLMSKISWKAIHNKYSARLFKRFFKVASLILQSTIIQHNENAEQYKEVLKHIDNIYSKVCELNYTKPQIGLLLGNLSEYIDTHYTFVELIAFVRFLAAKN